MSLFWLNWTRCSTVCWISGRFHAPPGVVTKAVFQCLFIWQRMSCTVYRDEKFLIITSTCSTVNIAAIDWTSCLAQLLIYSDLLMLIMIKYTVSSSWITLCQLVTFYIKIIHCERHYWKDRVQYHTCRSQETKWILCEIILCRGFVWNKITPK